MSSEKRFNQLIDKALTKSFSGWDFAFVDERIVEAELSWKYQDLVKNRILSSRALLDMCTGGGEFLDQINELPKKTYATEGYAPNVAIAKKRLEHRGVQVVAVESDEHLPLADNEFDLIINRHGAYSPREVSRVSVQSGATFVTQQVGSNNVIGLNEALFASVTMPNWNLHTAIDGLSEQGFVIKNGIEEEPLVAFKDIGAVVFYLKAIPWQIPDFEYSKYRHKLFKIHKQIESHGSFDTNAHRFFIEATVG